MIQSVPQIAVIASQRLNYVKIQILHQLAVIYRKNNLSQCLSMTCLRSMNWSPLAEDWRSHFHYTSVYVPRYRYQSYRDISLRRYQSTRSGRSYHAACSIQGVSFLHLSSGSDLQTVTNASKSMDNGHWQWTLLTALVNPGTRPSKLQLWNEGCSHGYNSRSLR